VGGGGGGGGHLSPVPPGSAASERRPCLTNRSSKMCERINQISYNLIVKNCSVL
jgi:hypothetical protein